MIKIPNTGDVRKLRAFFDEAAYSETGLKQRFEISRPPTREELPTLLHLTREPTPLNAVTRLFLLGESLDREAGSLILPGWFLDLCVACDLIEISHGKIQPQVVVVPIEYYLFASDAFHLLGTDQAKDFVLPASTHSANFLRHLCLRRPVSSMLDLCSGCGIHGLFASTHSDSVVVSDINTSATRFGEFNALLNDRSNVECVTGDLFAPLAGRQFDLIVSNPPFVLGPGEEFVYRDNPMELDSFCQQLVREAPAYLQEAGCLQMLCEWVEIEGQPWQERLTDWVRDSGCDAWILRSPPRTPAAYATLRLSDISGPNLPTAQDHSTWVNYLESRNVVAIHPGMVLLRKRTGKNWFHVHNLTSDIREPAGQAILQSLIACDFVAGLSSDESLLETTLRLAPQLKLEQHFVRSDNQWQPKTVRLGLTGNLPMEAEVDLPIMALLNQFDGAKTTNTCIEEFAEATRGDVTKLKQQILPVLRMLVERGFLQGV